MPLPFRLSHALYSVPLIACFIVGVVGDPTLRRRDEHGHGHHIGSPLLELNETEIAMWHPPTPPSYYSFDWEDSPSTSHRGLMMAHVLIMSLAFFIVYPISECHANVNDWCLISSHATGIALRAAKHPWHRPMIGMFYLFSVLGCALSSAYSKLTLNMYLVFHKDWTITHLIDLGMKVRIACMSVHLHN